MEHRATGELRWATENSWCPRRRPRLQSEAVAAATEMARQAAEGTGPDGKPTSLFSLLCPVALCVVKGTTFIFVVPLVSFARCHRPLVSTLKWLLRKGVLLWTSVSAKMDGLRCTGLLGTHTTAACRSQKPDLPAAIRTKNSGWVDGRRPVCPGPKPPLTSSPRTALGGAKHQPV
jgi:hypothetical protein